MATEAQVQANRSNARKSTGPRTAEGKATVAQNAVKHGFSGRLDVIRGEEQAEFDLFREQMLGEWAPDGMMETMLVERIVSLSWRLKRAERMQSEAFEALLTPDTSNLAVRLAQSLRPKRSEEEAEAEGELAFGRAVVKDFGHSRVLDRLSMYERRIEHSLYRTMAELQRLRLVRELNGATGNPVRSGPVRASEETPDGVTTNKVGRGRPTPDQVGGRLYKEPRGVAEKAPAGASAATDESCKTKPISTSPRDGQAPGNAEVTDNSTPDEVCRTKPIGAGGLESRPYEGTPDAGAPAAARMAELDDAPVPA